MKILLLLGILLLIAGCSSLEKRKEVPPSVSTANVIQSLTDTKEVLVEAGEQNTTVAKKIDKALTLAERLDALLEQIEKEAAQQANKNIVKPE
jgi:outer membrane murein-binding lipoprotein Lpp